MEDLGLKEGTLDWILNKYIVKPSVFLDVTRSRLVVTDVVGELSVPI